MPAFAANIDYLFSETPKIERIARAAAANFRGIEVGYLTIDELGAVRAAVSRTPLEVILLSLGTGDLATGGAGYMGIPGSRTVVEREVRIALHHAISLGCRRIAVPPSRVPQGTARAACLAALTEHLAYAADIAASEGVEITLEPINSIDWPGFLIVSTDDALDVIKSVAKQNVGLQLDLYHTAMQGESVLETIHRAAVFLRHVQFADVPGRHEPGTGTLPLREAFTLLDHVGYRGWTCAEYRPTRVTEQTLSWLGSPAKSCG